MIPPTPQEIAYRFCWALINIGDMSLPHYWSNLFLAMNSLLSEEQLAEIKKMVREVDFMCGTKKIITYDKDDNKIETIEPQMKLYEIETYLMNSWNLKKYFLVNGKKVTQFEIEKKLFDIKSWCYMQVFQMQHEILFTKPPQRV